MSNTNYIGPECVEDADAQSWILTDGGPGACSYCGNETTVVPLAELAQRIDGPYRKYHEPGDWTIISGDASQDHDHEQDGTDPADIVSAGLGCTTDIADGIREILHGYELRDIEDGELPMYEPDWNYTVKLLPGDRKLELWLEFVERLKHERRFFDPDAEALLDSILGGSLEDLWYPSPVRSLPAGTQLFRARIASTDQEASVFVANPIDELGPPPPTKAQAGRMNSPGISMFYGAFDEETSIAEVRPTVGSTVVVTSFETVRPMQVLDLSVFESGGASTVSFLEPDFEDVLVRQSFLAHFHEIIARPISRADSDLEFLPTQAVAEYVRNVLGFDGIVFRSAQLNGRSDNVVLFPESSHIEDSERTARASAAPGLRHIADGAKAVAIRAVDVEYLTRTDIEDEGLLRIVKVLPTLIGQWNGNAAEWVAVLLNPVATGQEIGETGIRLLQNQQVIVTSLAMLPLQTSGELRGALEELALHYRRRLEVATHIVNAIGVLDVDAEEAAWEDWRDLNSADVVEPILRGVFDHPLITATVARVGLRTDEFVTAIIDSRPQLPPRDPQ